MCRLLLLLAEPTHNAPPLPSTSRKRPHDNAQDDNAKDVDNDVTHTTTPSLIQHHTTRTGKMYLRTKCAHCVRFLLLLVGLECVRVFHPAAQACFCVRCVCESMRAQNRSDTYYLLARFKRGPLHTLSRSLSNCSSLFCRSWHSL